MKGEGHECIRYIGASEAEQEDASSGGEIPLQNGFL